MGTRESWTAHEDSLLEYYWRRGTRCADIAKAVGRSEMASRVRARRLSLGPHPKADPSWDSGDKNKKPPPDKPPLSKKRKCLMCGRQFASQGPHNRICQKCKSTGAWKGGQDLHVHQGPAAG